MSLAFHSHIEIVGGGKSSQPETNEDRKRKYEWDIVWRNIIAFIVLHVLSFHGVYVALRDWKIGILLFAYAYGLLVAQGITAGAHRLWSHRSYKAKLPLRILLLFFQTTAFQNSVFVWVRDHRMHHKFTDTDADPHNAKRGFFFSHMGWLFVKKQKEVKEKGKVIDMTDITNDPILMFQHRYYAPLMLICCFLIPTLIPVYLWHEDLYPSFAMAAAFRYIFSVHSTWLVNSAAHIYGMKPYDRNIGPTENKLVSHLACGEGWHNYHHVFPWDYKTSELGNYRLNLTLAFIDLCAKFGWAYDLKTVPHEVVTRRALRTGDGSRKIRIKEIWGWGDEDMTIEDTEAALIINKSQ
ncbi:PREDICTED: acyl-CoA Delta(11) desaturase-like [Nicrophorus vespilloides]|uniref:Acyl-CoA Delta(11) desaturase-like n=1 Tax=Nicrophorus vespilloides TaxID=110193 RepID=A0ABM1N259_NICVS|nr:PREDICTED: acyl-CoA Delta(11) desaturase-like [Nicrophorus vespilloides]